MIDTMKKTLISWDQKLSTAYNYLLTTGVLVIAIYIIFQVTAFFFPFFSHRFIFQLFDVGHESNIPTYFSVLLFFCLAIMSWIISLFENIDKKTSNLWKFAIPVFLFLGADELASIHEQLTYPTQRLLTTTGLLEFAWVIPYALLILVLAYYYIPLILKLRFRNLILLGAGVFVVGALGFEMLSAYYYASFDVGHVGFIIASSIEEIFEISGLLILVFALKKELLFQINK